MACPLEDVVLLHDFLEAALILHERLVDRLERHEFTREPMNSEVHLTERSFTNDLADLVVVNFGHEYIVRNVEQDVVENLLARR